MLVPRMVNLVSVELDGEPLQQIHQILHWNELETNLYLVSTTIKCIFNFFY